MLLCGVVQGTLAQPQTVIATEWDAAGLMAGGQAAAEPPAVHTPALNTEALVPNAMESRLRSPVSTSQVSEDLPFIQSTDSLHTSQLREQRQSPCPCRV